jgi:hypothetical protein
MLLHNLLYLGLPRFILGETFFSTLRFPLREGLIRESLSINSPAVPWLMTLITTRAPTLRDRW